MSKKAPSAGAGRTDRQSRATLQAPTPAGTIRVQAFAVGTYDEIRRRIGDVFDLHPRTDTFTQLVKDKDGKPELDKSGLLPTRVVEEKDDVTLTAEQQFNPKWMRKVSKRTPERAVAARESINAEHDTILRNRLAGPVAVAEQVSASGTAPGTGDVDVFAEE